MKYSRLVVLGFLVAMFAVITDTAQAARLTYKPARTAGGSMDGGPLPVPTAEPAGGTVGGNFFYCSAIPRLGERCYTLLLTFNADGSSRKRCAAVTFNASCQCDLASGAVKGSCTVWP